MSNSQVRRARRLYQEFRERTPGKVKRITIEVPEALAVMGYADFIGYRTTHGRRAHLYRHDFADGSRPLLCAGTDDKQLYLIGGRYRVTRRGIVDLDARGEEIED